MLNYKSSWYFIFIITVYQIRVSISCQMSECLPSSKIYTCSGKFNTEIFKEPCDTNGTSHMTMCCEANSSHVLLHSTYGAEPNEFPFMAKLLLPQNCGGTIYNKRFIITAAHCVFNEGIEDVLPVEHMQVILGSNSAKTEYTENVYKVKGYVIHENFTYRTSQAKKEANDRLAYDIALIELNRDIEFGPYVKTLKLAPKEFDASDFAESMIVVSWGTSTALWTDINYLEHPSHLQKLNFLIRKNDDCFGTEENSPPNTTNTHIPFKSYKVYQDSLVCLGGIMKGKWSPMAAVGDSGSPAICRGADGHALLCGHAYMGVLHEECFPNPNEVTCEPSLFIKTPYFGEWIENIAGLQDESTYFQPFVYGEPVKQTEIVHQVHIITESGKCCGGTLIQNDIVLTAASCVTLLDGSVDKVKIYIWNNQTFAVVKTSILDNFKLLGDPVTVMKKTRVLFTDQYYQNDLAILKLDGKVTGDLNGKLPRLPEDGEVFKNGKEFAFSRKESVGAKQVGDIAMIMLRQFELLDDKECDRRTERMKDIGGLKFIVDWDDNIMCGFEKSSGGSICDRELGGGLICEGGNGEMALCGVQVFRLCEWSVPNGFLEVGKYLKWIKMMMEEFDKIS